MEFTYIASMFSMILIYRILSLIKNNRCKEMNLGKTKFLIIIIVTLIAFTYLLDTIAILGYQLDFWELPSETGVISEVRYNSKIGGLSKIIFSGTEYQIEMNLLKDRNVVNNGGFCKNREYKIIITPIHRNVYDIIDLENTQF